MPLRKKLKTDSDDKVEEKELDEESPSPNESADDNDDSNEDEEDDDDDDDDQGESGSDDDDEGPNEFESNEEIMIDFEARSPSKIDLEPIRNLLQQKLAPFTANIPFTLNDLAKSIVEQTHIGNVIYQGSQEEKDDASEEPSPFPMPRTAPSTTNEDSEETIFGVLSLIDLNETKFKQISTGLVDFIMGRI